MSNNVFFYKATFGIFFYKATFKAKKNTNLKYFGNVKSNSIIYNKVWLQNVQP